MRKYQIVLLVLLALSTAVSVSAQTWNAKTTSFYNISIPSDWTVAIESDTLFTAMRGGESLTPITVVVAVQKITEDDKDKSLEVVADEALKEGNAELLAMGLEDAIDVVESGEVKFNGYNAYHNIVKVSIMGMNIYTHTYMFQQGENFIQLVIMGDEAEVIAQETELAAIKKSFSLK